LILKTTKFTDIQQKHQRIIEKKKLSDGQQKHQRITQKKNQPIVLPKDNKNHWRITESLGRIQGIGYSPMDILTNKKSLVNLGFFERVLEFLNG
jgi:hypothetical protein